MQELTVQNIHQSLFKDNFFVVNWLGWSHALAIIVMIMTTSANNNQSKKILCLDYHCFAIKVITHKLTTHICHHDLLFQDWDYKLTY